MEHDPKHLGILALLIYIELGRCYVIGWYALAAIRELRSGGLRPWVSFDALVDETLLVLARFLAWPYFVYRQWVTPPSSAREQR